MVSPPYERVIHCTRNNLNGNVIVCSFNFDSFTVRKWSSFILRFGINSIIQQRHQTLIGFFWMVEEYHQSDWLCLYNIKADAIIVIQHLCFFSHRSVICSASSLLSFVYSEIFFCFKTTQWWSSLPEDMLMFSSTLFSYLLTN